HPSVAPQWVTRTNHAVSDPTGRPLMLFNSEGKTVWRPGQTSLWGLALSLPADTDYPDPRGELDPEAAPGLLYAGQWRDAESGLCYNRFRYYEPETGMYLVSDPLGLQGGEQTYRYVPNPLGYVDPLGLAICPVMYDWYKYNRSQGMTAAQAHQAIKNASPQDVLNYALHRQGLSGHNYPIKFKEKFTVGNYKYEVRAHDVNPTAPAGSNSANGPIYRIGRSQSGTNPATNQGYGWEYGSPDGSWHHTSDLKTKSPNYNPGAANDTHIPLPTGTIP
ncbi:TPA: RHS repeat-associated core domain-containing protein, partial [Escherichia coli]